MSKQKWEEKKTSLGNAIVMSAVMLAVGILVGVNWNSWFGGFAPYLGIESNVSSDMDWSALNEVYNKLATTYNGEISKEDVVEGAKKGLVESLGDVYTVYMDSEESSDFYDDLHGNVGSGIGVEMGLRDGYVRVLRTLPDNPAREAGILAGDIIYKVDGEEVYSLSADEIAKKVRGETGSEVTVTVVRDAQEKSFTMKRETINNVSAYVEYDGKTAVITVTRFDNDTGTMVQGFAKEFADKGVKKVILDLRGNGGGYVSAAQDLLSLWLDGEKILIQKSKHFGNSATNSGSGKAILKDIKTVVLVNGSTASASEIVAGALQDYGKATVVGETTYGKGVVQNLYDLSGATVLKVTTAEWYTPNDRSINETGITPDIEVERTYEDINAMRDPQMDKAKGL
ncbi:S41 family peptidase [Candidatus Nanosyncoccus alces]|uniref:CtpA-like serine protease n=1 Tax=Candidatus Nanosyncoccus alces TaxID=2171997 RepID=A0ABY0FQL4_9BACT|nr:S41 family peptidase [Candidatus Nanosyncoccus alces]RYC75194.1 putative CtpA-like serine protease [Candidatus Nanosyncoccus alces]